MCLVKSYFPETLRSNLIYKFSCGKPVKGTLSTSVRDHMLVCDHKVVHEDFKFLGNESNRCLLELKESLFIKRDRPSLNKNLYL